MAKRKRIRREVVCPNDPGHVFSFVFDIEAGTENVPSKVQAYCARCDNFVQVLVMGKPPDDDEVLRRFEDQ